MESNNVYNNTWRLEKDTVLCSHLSESHPKPFTSSYIQSYTTCHKEIMIYMFTGQIFNFVRIRGYFMNGFREMKCYGIYQEGLTGLCSYIDKLVENNSLQWLAMKIPSLCNHDLALQLYSGVKHSRIPQWCQYTKLYSELRELNWKRRHSFTKQTDESSWSF